MIPGCGHLSWYDQAEPTRGDNRGCPVSKDGGSSHTWTQLHLIISMHGTLEAGSESYGVVLPKVQSLGPQASQAEYLPPKM